MDSTVIEICFPEKRAGVLVRWKVNPGVWIKAGAVIGVYTVSPDSASGQEEILNVKLMSDNEGIIREILVAEGAPLLPG